MSFSCTADIFLKQFQRESTMVLMESYAQGKWSSYTVKKCISIISSIQQYLINEGLKQGDLVLIMPELANAETILVDMACQLSGYVSVLVHNTCNQIQFNHIIQETDAGVLFYKDELTSQKFTINDRIKTINLEELTSTVSIQLKTSFRSPLKPIQPTDLSTIIYTSGTTGLPKGVMLTHKNIISNVTSLATLLPLQENHRILSFLPYSHAFERTLILSYMTIGTKLYLAYEKQFLPQAFQYAKPHVFTAVPRILEKMYNQIIKKADQSKFIGKASIYWAIKTGEKYRSKQIYNPIIWVRLFLIRRIIFSRFRKKLGNQLKAIVVGAAYLNPNLARLFSASGIPIREGYGLREASPVVTVNRMNPGLNRFGTVGIPLPGVKVNIVNCNEDGEGEIHVKGPNVMKGYFKNETETAKVLSKDGWLNTGDVGKIVHQRFLKITDRKKDIFKTSLGKYVAPQMVESTYLESPFIEQIVIIGFQKPFIVALVYPDMEALEDYAHKHSIHWTSPKYMVLNIKVKEKIQQEIASISLTLANHERIKHIHLMDQPMSIENGLLSNTLKTVRKKVRIHYEKEIETLYAKK